MQAPSACVQALQAVYSDAGSRWTRADAATNCGNCLCARAELAAAHERVGMLCDALQCYDAALALDTDADTHGSRADALLQLAQALPASQSSAAQPKAALQRAASCLANSVATADPAQLAVAAIQTARAAYQDAVSWCSDEQGDDLPGLLCNWATGLVSAAEVCVQCGQQSHALALLREAVQHAEASLEFNRGDVQVRLNSHDLQCGGSIQKSCMLVFCCIVCATGCSLQNALTALLVVQVPGVLASAHLAAAERSSRQDRSCLLTNAIAAAEQALAIDRGHAASLVLKAEAHCAAAKHACSLSAEHSADAQQQWQLCRDAYREALHKPRKLGACLERCVVCYNYACALCACGEDAEALRVLQGVAQRDVSALEGMDNDADLARLVASGALAGSPLQTA